MDPIPLPFFRHPNELPATLPTRSEIEAATVILPTTRHPDHDGRLVVIRKLFVVKYGQRVLENEGNALLFVEKHLSIPVPRLYAMYRIKEKLFLVMQFIPGRDLKSAWPDLSEDGKLSISRQLRNIWDSMRSLPSPDLYCNVTRGPLPFRFFQCLDENSSITGPFHTAKDLALALALHSQQNWAYNNRRGWVSEFFKRNLPKTLKDDRSTFSHSDIHRQNILIQEIPAEGENDRKFVVTAILDWETAGWYPRYWEYASTFVDMGWWDDWPEKCEAFLDPWPSEAAMLKWFRLIKTSIQYNPPNDPGGILVPSIFLAGSIEMDKAIDWQASFIKGLWDLEVAIFNPRDKNFESSLPQDPNDKRFKDQVHWEMDQLKAASVIALWPDFDHRLEQIRAIEVLEAVEARWPRIHW